MVTRKPKENKPAEPLKDAKPADLVNEVKAEKVVKKPKTIKTTKKPASKKVVSKVKSLPTEKIQPAKAVIQEKKEQKQEKSAMTDRGPIILGAGLLLMGILLLGGRLLHIPFGEFLWPFIFIVPGALVFLSAISSDNSSGEGLAILGGILGTLGAVFLMQTVTGLWASWAYIWALIAPTSIGLSQLVYGNIKNRDKIAATGWRLTRIGLFILAGGFIFFELILGISGFGLRRFGLPVFPMILIFLGAFTLVRSILRPQ